MLDLIAIEHTKCTVFLGGTSQVGSFDQPKPFNYAKVSFSSVGFCASTWERMIISSAQCGVCSTFFGKALHRYEMAVMNDT